MVASPTAAVIQGRSVFSAACRQGWPHLVKSWCLLQICLFQSSCKKQISTCKKQIATANSKLLVYLFWSDQSLRPSKAICHLRHPSGWYSGALVVFCPAVIDIRSPSIQSDSLLQLRPILYSKLVELAVECPQIYTSSFHNQVQLCRMEKVLDGSSIECPLSRAPLDKPDGVEPTKPRGAWRDALCITNHFLCGGTHTEVAGVKFAAKAGAIVLARFKSLVKAKIKRPCLKPYVGLLFQQCWESHRDGQLQREL